MPSVLFPELNNLGVDALESGDYPRAVEFFRYALRSVQSDIRSGWLQQQQQRYYSQHPQQQQQWNSHDPHQGAVSSSPASLSSSSMNEHHHLPNGLSQLPFVYQISQAAAASPPAARTAGAPQHLPQVEEDQNPMKIYTRGFRLLDRPGQIYFSHDHIVETKICSSIVIFNLGLSFHLQSLKKKKLQHNRVHMMTAASSSFEIRNAKALYQQVFRLLVGDHHLDANDNNNYDGRPWSTGNALLDLVRMAVVNNMAQISLDCMDYLESDRYSACLIRMSNAVASAWYSTDATTNVNIQVLLQNESKMFMSHSTGAMNGDDTNLSLLPHNAAPAA